MIQRIIYWFPGDTAMTRKRWQKTVFPVEVTLSIFEVAQVPVREKPGLIYRLCLEIDI